MPRRPAPTPLSLAVGPTPARGQPRHTLPAPPQPVFKPNSIRKPRSSSSASLSSHGTNASAFLLGGLTGTTPADKSSVDGVMFEPMHRNGHNPQWDSGHVVARKSSAGPWDHTRGNTLPQEKIADLVAVPKPVVSNPVPLW